MNAAFDFQKLDIKDFFVGRRILRALIAERKIAFLSTKIFNGNF